MPTLVTGEELDSPKKGCPGYDTKLHLIVRLQTCSLENVEYSFITITLRVIIIYYL